jgi:hypothetical protein
MATRPAKESDIKYAVMVVVSESTTRHCRA